MWVCGSYARGAPACGDLDLIAETSDVSGYRPSIGTIKNALFGRTSHVSLYWGNPDFNNSGVEFKDARLVWSTETRHSIEIIDQIPIILTEGHFKRKSDVIPLRLDQICGHLETIDEIVDLHSQNKIEWEFIEFNPCVDNLELRDDEKRVLISCQTSAGRELNTVLPSIINTLRRHRPGGSWSSIDNKSGHRLKYSKIAISFKTLEWSSMAFAKIGIDEQGFVPSLSKRGPNGIWLIRRT